MISEFYSELSQDFASLHERADDYDIDIVVGQKQPALKSFQAHRNILRARSPYFRRYLTSRDSSDNTSGVQSDEFDSIFNKTTPAAFDVILKYIYTGKLIATWKTKTEFLDVLVLAGNLEIQQITNFLQDKITVVFQDGLQDEVSAFLNDWPKQNFANFERISRSNDLFGPLRTFCQSLVSDRPEIILGTTDFFELPSFVIRDLFKTKLEGLDRVYILLRIIEWGIIQCPSLREKNSIDAFPKTPLRTGILELGTDDLVKLKQTLDDIPRLVSRHATFTNELTKDSHFEESITPPCVINLLKIVIGLEYEELIGPLEEYFIFTMVDWAYKNFASIKMFSASSPSLTRLDKFCDSTIRNLPEVVLRSSDFVNLDETTLSEILRNEFTPVSEIHLWKKLIRWGVARIPELSEDRDEWEDKDWKKLHDILFPFFPSIRFGNISKSDLGHEILPNVHLLPKKLYQELFQWHLDTGIKTSSISSLPRHRLQPDSTLMDEAEAAWISNNMESKYKDKAASEIPSDPLFANYHFRLLCRGTRDGFDARVFDRSCNNKGPVVILVKLPEFSQVCGRFIPSGLPLPDQIGGFVDTFSFTFLDHDIAKARVFHGVTRKGSSLFSFLGFGFFQSGVMDVGNKLPANSDPEKVRDAAFLFPLITLKNNDGNFFLEEFEVYQVIKCNQDD